MIRIALINGNNECVESLMDSLSLLNLEVDLFDYENIRFSKKYYLYFFINSPSITVLINSINEVNRNTKASVFTAFKGETVDLTTLYEIGVDGLIENTKNLEEVQARVENILGINSDRTKSISFYGYVIDQSQKALIKPDGSSINLDSSETLLLYELAKHRNLVCNRDQLVAALHKDRIITNRTIDLAVNSIRSKFRRESIPAMIKNIYGVGYMLCTSDYYYERV